MDPEVSQIPKNKNPDDSSPPAPPPARDSAEDSHPDANPAKTVRWSTQLTREFAPPSDADMPPESNLSPTPPPPPPTTTTSSKVSMETIKGMLGRWGKKAKESAKQTARKTEDYAGNVWQHLKTGPSVADTALGRIAHTTKVLAEGGYEKIFRTTFDAHPDEKLKKTFACYLSTSSGPVMGILYLSTSRLAFCSDNPLSYQVEEKTEWSYYKVVIPLQQLSRVNSSESRANRAEKYIQVVSIDNHEFWFMGFMNYETAVKSLQEASLAKLEA